MPDAGPRAPGDRLAVTGAVRHRGPLLLVAVLLALASAACGGDDGDAAATPEDLGAETYAWACASCHGADLRGSIAGPSHLSAVYEPGHHPDDAFRSAIANGVRAHHWGFGDMPPVPGLSDEQVDAVIAYVRAQQEEHGFEPYPPAPANTPGPARPTAPASSPGG